MNVHAHEPEQSHRVWDPLQSKIMVHLPEDRIYTWRVVFTIKLNDEAKRSFCNEARIDAAKPQFTEPRLSKREALLLFDDGVASSGWMQKYCEFEFLGWARGDHAADEQGQYLHILRGDNKPPRDTDEEMLEDLPDLGYINALSLIHI